MQCGHFSCGTCAADGDRCRACREGYTFDDARTCVPCSDPLCAQCGPPGACTACKEQAPADTVPTAVPETNAWDPSTIPVYMDRLGTCRKCKAVGPCLECNSEGRCTRCPEYSLQPFHMIPAFMLTKAGCVMCRGVNCVRCDPSAPDRCLKCQGAADPDPDSAFVPFPTYVDPKTGSCKECTKHPVLSGCAECSGSDSGQACQKCLPGYMLRGGQCLRCRDPLCKVCTGAKADRCLKCKAVESDSSGPKAVFMGADGMCRKYNGTACIKAASAVRCLECEPANCMQYSESGSLYCYHRNMLDPSTGRCISCEALTGDPHCDVCTLQGACLRCRSDTGWMPAGPDGKRRCAPCVDKRCEVCQADHRVCESCSEWEVLDFDNVQQIYRDPAGRCQPCKAPCFTCAPNGSCRSCIDDWRPDPARPGKCVACAKGAGCISCFSPLCDVCGTDGTCARCKRNPDVGPTCRPCKAVRYCAECDAAGACVRCNALDEPDAPASFGLDDSGQCRTCQDPKCTSCTTDFRTCQACQSWFGLNAYMDTAGRCRNCTQPRCKQCAADGSCAVCSEGYPHAGRCGRCTDPNCAYCPEDPARCEGCRGGGDMGDPGFFMDQQGLCHKCPWKGCVACNPDGSCAMCHSGYFKRQRWGVAAGGCSPCAKGQSCVRCQIEYEYLCSACTRRLGELECTACGGWAQGATSLLGFEFDKKCRLVRGPEPGR